MDGLGHHEVRPDWLGRVGTAIGLITQESLVECVPNQHLEPTAYGLCQHGASKSATTLQKGPAISTMSCMQLPIFLRIVW